MICTSVRFGDVWLRCRWLWCRAELHRPFHFLKFSTSSLIRHTSHQFSLDDYMNECLLIDVPPSSALRISAAVTPFPAKASFLIPSWEASIWSWLSSAHPPLHLLAHPVKKHLDPGAVQWELFPNSSGSECQWRTASGTWFGETSRQSQAEPVKQQQTGILSNHTYQKPYPIKEQRHILESIAFWRTRRKP